MADKGGSKAKGQVGVTMTTKYFSIKNCDFVYKCPRTWEKLELTQVEGERHCTACDKLVYLCADDSDLIRHARAGHCVAVANPQRPDGMSVGQVGSGYSIDNPMLG